MRIREGKKKFLKERIDNKNLTTEVVTEVWKYSTRAGKCA
jgi:hypothetical protein